MSEPIGTNPTRHPPSAAWSKLRRHCILLALTVIGLLLGVSLALAVLIWFGESFFIC